MWVDTIDTIALAEDDMLVLPLTELYCDVDDDDNGFAIDNNDCMGKTIQNKNKVAHRHIAILNQTTAKLTKKNTLAHTHTHNETKIFKRLSSRMLKRFQKFLVLSSSSIIVESSTEHTIFEFAMKTDCLPANTRTFE